MAWRGGHKYIVHTYRWDLLKCSENQGSYVQPSQLFLSEVVGGLKMGGTKRPWYKKPGFREDSWQVRVVCLLQGSRAHNLIANYHIITGNKPKNRKQQYYNALDNSHLLSSLHHDMWLNHAPLPTEMLLPLQGN